MSKKKYRGNSKIKREHGMIDGLDSYLKSIEHFDDIISILTGVITVRKGHGGFKFQVQYQTDSGLKCLAKNQGSVQEVFVTTSNPESVEAVILAQKQS